MHKQDLLLVWEAKTKHSTLRTVLRACEGKETVPKFPVTSWPNAGTDGVRMKLQTGMNSLGKTLGKFKPDQSQCPRKQGSGRQGTRYKARRELL